MLKLICSFQLATSRLVILLNKKKGKFAFKRCFLNSRKAKFGEPSINEIHNTELG